MNGKFDALMKTIFTRWPNHNKDDVRVDMYVEDVSDLVEECGFERVLSAAGAAHTRNRFLPEPPELRDLLPEPEPDPYPGCRKCNDSGWDLVHVPSRVNPGKMELEARRCACIPTTKRALVSHTEDEDED